MNNLTTKLRELASNWKRIGDYGADNCACELNNFISDNLNEIDRTSAWMPLSKPFVGGEEREDKAVDALITLTLHQDKSEGINPEEINKYMSGNFKLTPEEEAALKRRRLA